ncbi:disulfide bond formation protein B [Caldimonas brevitalea]|uniref:Disulfide bond formation protein DsbB n=1 Tax=Caldimonas brevitalea TaxID=413882 RepID=A0A0G3BK72_9BURK|nr:disulfide bond formation protein B [Caldimonas brevitalea]AKJ28393.1 disulfide bond formation protein DsbB [Caldimonas brevitalea]
MRPTASRLLGFTCLASLAAVAAALVSQYQFGMAPCPWCILQRVIFVLMALLAGLAWAVKAPALRRVLAGLTALAAGSGIAAAVYQHTVASQSFSCSLTLADKIIQALKLEQALPFVFRVKASCADAAVTLLGLPYEYWSLGLYALLLLACGVVVVRPRP